ncbi:hypothetical protein AB0F24_15570 [Streptomyces platensis]|uniref:hypothetical protein n=1 Tax=Streptomyces platensis TaxID=58346 RepID=UPI0033CA63F8
MSARRLAVVAVVEETTVPGEFPCLDGRVLTSSSLLGGQDAGRNAMAWMARCLYARGP